VKILVVDDDPVVQELLAVVLEKDGFEPLVAADPPTALGIFARELPSLALLDVNLGSWSGFDLLRDLRRRSSIPIIMLTVRAAEEDVLRGFNLGANDYVTKPFRYRELIARIRAQLRGPDDQAWQIGQGGPLEVASLRLDPLSHTVRQQGHEIHVTPIEFRLLQYLMSHAGRVVPTRILLKQVWGYEDSEASGVVRATVYRLRQKLEAANGPQILRTVPSVGVLLDAGEWSD
jgi:two-component system response regulator MtrA